MSVSSASRSLHSSSNLWRTYGREGIKRKTLRLASLTSRTSLEPQATAGSLKQAKQELLSAISGTNRGSRASFKQRGLVEEKQVAVENFQATTDLNYEALGGLWLLRYTRAQDVLPILEAESAFPNPFGMKPLQVGNIYQRFTSPEDGLGKIDNVIQLGVPFFLSGRDGLTATVEASYEVRSGHTIALTFDAANVGHIKISPALEAFIAPALLPRTPFQHATLLALKEFNLRFPFRSAAQIAQGIASGNSRQPTGGSYQLTYLDEDMLIGRAAALGGTFVFTRESPKHKASGSAKV